MYPNFILGGVMKSGTTFLHNLLTNHPQIAVLKRNMDYAYFDDDRIYARGKAWYEALFTEIVAANPDKVIGQTSADCNFNPGSVERVMAYNPETKLIFVLRHPIDRAYSLYWHQYGMGREHKSFEKAIASEPKRIKKSYHHFKHYSYLGRSRYKRQFDDIMALVPSENLLLLDFDALIKDTKATVNIVLDFLRVSLVENLEELNFASLPRNPAKITLNPFVVTGSFYLQEIGLNGPGRRLINLFRQEIKPPKMQMATRKQLEQELAEDIAFFEQVKATFEVKKNI
jgi:hypothetical protein